MEQLDDERLLKMGRIIYHILLKSPRPLRSKPVEDRLRWWLDRFRRGIESRGTAKENQGEDEDVDELALRVPTKAEC